MSADSFEAYLAELKGFFRGLADENRIRILNLLAGEDLCVCDIVTATGLSQPVVSRHLAYLRRHGMVDVIRVGRFAHYYLTEPRDPIHESILELFSGNLSRIADFQRERGLAASSRTARLAAGG